MYSTTLMVGNVATDPILRHTVEGTAVTNFRLAATERRFDSASQLWVDGEKLFLAVTCWRRLAEGVHATLSKGDPVVVVGKLHTRNYEHEGQPRTTTELTASSVGPDLCRCTAQVQRKERPTADDMPRELAVA